MEVCGQQECVGGQDPRLSQDPRLDIRGKDRPHTDLVQQIYIPFYWYMSNIDTLFIQVTKEVT